MIKRAPRPLAAKSVGAREVKKGFGGREGVTPSWSCHAHFQGFKLKLKSRAFCWCILWFCTSNSSFTILKLVGFSFCLTHPVSNVFEDSCSEVCWFFVDILLTIVSGTCTVDLFSSGIREEWNLSFALHPRKIGGRANYQLWMVYLAKWPQHGPYYISARAAAPCARATKNVKKPQSQICESCRKAWFKIFVKLKHFWFQSYIWFRGLLLFKISLNKSKLQNQMFDWNQKYFCFVLQKS